MKPGDTVINMPAEEGHELREVVSPLCASQLPGETLGLRPVHSVDKTSSNYLRKDYHMKMFKNPHETVVQISLAAEKKSLIPIWKLFILCVYSGMFVGIGGSVALFTGGAVFEMYYDASLYNISNIATQPLPILARASFAMFFPIGLVFIVLMGGELFTGNTMFFSVGVLSKKTSYTDLLVSWASSFFGNYCGCVLFALIMWGCNLVAPNIYLMSYLNTLIRGKLANGWGVTFFRAIPCNFLVNAAIFLGIAAEDILSKIVALWLPIFAFAVLSFEHCIANLFLFTLDVLVSGGTNFNYGTFIYWNLIPVTLGNILGGALFLGFVWWLLYFVSVEKKEHRHFRQSHLSSYHLDPNVNNLHSTRSWFAHFFGDCFDTAELRTAWKSTDPDESQSR